MFDSCPCAQTHCVLVAMWTTGTPSMLFMCSSVGENGRVLEYKGKVERRLTQKEEGLSGQRGVLGDLAAQVKQPLTLTCWRSGPCGWRKTPITMSGSRLTTMRRMMMSQADTELSMLAKTK